MLLPANPAAMAANFNLDEFLSVSFTHHMEILNKTATAEERFFYIHQTFIHQLSNPGLITPPVRTTETVLPV